jgi:peptidoglycan hydrolase-like amidase
MLVAVMLVAVTPFAVMLSLPSVAQAATGPSRADVPLLSPSASPAVLPSDSTTVRIAMTENDTLDVIVTASTLAGQVSAPNVAAAPAVLFQPLGGGKWAVFSGTTCSGGPKGWQERDADAVNPTAAPVAAGGLLELCVGGTQSTVDQGTLTGVYDSTQQPRTVNTLGLEEYVADVVPGESPAYWATLGGAGPQDHDWGFQELEAQAVAVRSYVLAGTYGGYADTCDLTCQTYRGTEYETPASVAAAQDTAGEVMVMPTGRIATTEYSASTGGYSASSAETSPFTPVPDTGDAVCIPSACNPNHDWSKSVALSAIGARYHVAGTTVEITSSNGHGRAVELSVTGTAVAAATFVASFTLLSNYFTITSVSSGELHLVGHGWGHGIGMGQWGALGYAVATDNGQGNWTWRRIVDHFYQPAVLAQLPGSPTLGTATGGVGGFWLSAADGGIFSFGNAQFHGSMGGQPLDAPVVGMAATPTGGGYWEVAADGGIFSFGSSVFEGSAAGTAAGGGTVGMLGARTGAGYLVVSGSGTVTSFGDAPAYGDMATVEPGYAGHIVAGATTPA